MNTDSISINGYYLRPTLSYKASTIFGGDDSLRQDLRGALGVLGALGPADMAAATSTAASASQAASAASTAASASQAASAALAAAGSTDVLAVSAAPSAASFADILKAGIASVNSLQLESDDLATKFAAGMTDNIHEVMIAGEKADIALQFATAIRSKLLDAYQEIMRMQL